MPVRFPFLLSKWSIRLVLCLWTLACFYAFSYHLGDIPPYHNDENFYIVSSKHMVESGDYFTPTYHEKKRFAKPILFYWLVAASYKVFGVDLFSARLVSVVFGVLCVFLTYLTARRLWDRQVGLLAAFLLPGFYLHFQISRWAITDMTMNFFILSAFYFFIRGFQEETNRKRDFLLFYLCMALGFITKGPPAVLIPGLTVLLFLLAARQGHMKTEMRLWPGLGIFLVIVLPWFILMFVWHGDEFKNHIFRAEIQGRVFSNAGFSAYYFGVLFRYYLPWSLFLIPALAVYIGLIPSSPPGTQGKAESVPSLTGNLRTRFRGLFEREQQPILFCLIWILVPLILFTLFRIEHSRYMLPASPAAALLLAHFFAQHTGSPKAMRRAIFKIPFILTLLLFFVAALAAATGVISYNALAPTPFRITLLPVFLMFGTAGLLMMYLFRSGPRLVFALACFQIITLTSLSGDALPFFNRYPMRAFANEILQTGTGKERIGVYRLGNHRARLGVLTAYEAYDLFTPEMLRDFLDTDQKVFVVMKEAQWKNEFAELPLVLQSTGQAWAETRIDKERAFKILKKEFPPNPDQYLETLVLLTNQ